MSSKRIPFLIALIGTVLTVSATQPSTSANNASNLAHKSADKEFIAPEAGFTIKLPDKSDNLIILARDPRDQHITAGMRTWNLKQGEFIITFTELNSGPDDQRLKQVMLSSHRNTTVSGLPAREGELLSEQALNLGEDPGWELRARYPNDVLFIERIYCANHRFYQITATLEGDQRKHEAEVIKILESFNVVAK
ncbi:MAG: hypothetical protein ABIP75_03630 [Pyrinomonadaceae bacterium]